MNNTDNFGSRLATKRKALGITQNQLAEKLIISNKAVSKWESGMGYPSFELIPELCKILNCSADYLIMGNNSTINTKNFVSNIPLHFGTTKENKPFIKDLLDISSLLIVGGRGTGKTNLMHGFILDIIKNYSPTSVKLGLIDFQSSFNYYKNSKHLFTPICKTLTDAQDMLENAQKELKNRLKLLKEFGCSTIEEYNKNHSPAIPYHIIFVDECVDLTFTEIDRLNFSNDGTKRRQMASIFKDLVFNGEFAGIYIIASASALEYRILHEFFIPTFPARVTSGIKFKELAIASLGTDKPCKLKHTGHMLFEKINSNISVEFKSERITEEIIKSVIEFE